MGSHLIVTVHLHDERFYGVPEWPPSPARLFQALVAGAARGASLSEQTVKALEWLESLPPPTIWVPHSVVGSRVDLFVPNNDLDSQGGDPARIGEIRAKKLAQPRLLGPAPLFLYAFELPPDTGLANDLVMLTEQLYQFGRGIDLAWATAQIVDESSSTFANRSGQIFRPAKEGSPQVTLGCPTRGTLQSLTERYAANRRRLRLEGTGKLATVLFWQPPKARFVQVAYEAQPRRTVFDLRRGNDESKLYPWPLRRAAELVEMLRDDIQARLLGAMPESLSLIERYLVGRKINGSDAAPAADRARIIPLPSRGHEHVDPSIRRVLLEVPGNCPLRFEDVVWALSGQPHSDSTTGEILFLLVDSTESTVQEHYTPTGGARVWRSVTGAALPASRRRIDPKRCREEAKPARERIREEADAMTSVCAAVRHAGIDAQVTQVRVQREPFDRRGEHAERFAEGTRFNRHQMWHVEVAFDHPVRRPIVLGDGRFLGLGVMAPAVSASEGIWAFQGLTGTLPNADAEQIARALRRAVMSRAQAAIGLQQTLPQLISGHAHDGSPLRDEGHLTFQFDPFSRTLLLLAPHAVEHRLPFHSERDALKLIDQSIEGLTELRAGASGLLALKRIYLNGTDHPLLTASRTWTSTTPYLVTRHAKANDATQAVVTDIREECVRRGLPAPKSIEVINVRGLSGKGLTGNVRIQFAAAVSGPLFLGKSRYLGGGGFVGDQSRSQSNSSGSGDDDACAPSSR